MYIPVFKDDNQSCFLRNERLQLNKVKGLDNLTQFSLFFSFDLYAVQYRAETEIHRLKDDSWFQKKKNAQLRSPIPLAID
jgi:hypothetical protein